MSQKFVMSYSCGKDSTLALYRLIKQGYTPMALMVAVNKSKNRSWFHGIPNHIIEQVAKSLEIPVWLVESDGTNYTEKMEETLVKARAEGATMVAFGDIDLEAHRTWCTDRCDHVGLEPVFPLWQENREALTYEFIESNFKTVIKVVKLEWLDESFLGRVLDKEVVADIVATGADACGENGEYHTFVFDGPMFKQPITFEVGENVVTEDYGFLDLM